MVTYDGWYRNPKAAKSGIGVEDINPDLKTIENIQVMVERCLKFMEEFGPIIQDGFTFEPHGYTETVDNGDGDYLTANTLWDFKVSKYNHTNINSIQLLMYRIMGQHSGQRIYNKIKKLGIFNPRLNSVFTLDVSDFNPEVIEAAERDVICY